MQQKIKNNFNKIIMIFLLLQPFIDLLTGIGIHIFKLNITFGIVIRVIFLLFIVVTTVFVYKKKKALFWYTPIIIYCLFYILGIILFKDNSVLFIEIQNLIRFFYFPILLISFYILKEEIKISKMTLIMMLILYLIMIFVPILLNVGYQSYQISKQGTLGFFNSANEISGILSIITPFMFIALTKKKNIILSIMLMIIYLVVILTVGTKTPLLSFIITLGITTLYFIIQLVKNKKYKVIGYITTLFIIIIISFCFIIPKTNFYKNIETHLDFLKVDHISEIFTDKDLFDHFIFSQRLTFLEKRQDIYMNSNSYQKLLGVGFTTNSKTDKLVEMDYFDIYYCNGLVGFIIYFGIVGFILGKCSWKFKNITFENLMTYISFLLIILLAMFTGHIITSPAVSILVAVIILLLMKKDKKELLFTSYNLDVGGIETSLVNLLKNVDYKKYNVTLLLEKKEGIFLKDIPLEVKVKQFKVNEYKNIIIRKIINFSKKILFGIFNYHAYDYSCCYATYSLSGNKLTKIGSANNSIYIHSNYHYVYKTDEQFFEFFNARKIGEFNKIIFVSKEAREDFIKLYPNLENKTVVHNNFIDISKIKKDSTIDIKLNKNKTTLVFVGRLEDDSKKVGRAINLVKKIDDIDLWLVGDGPDRNKYEEIVKSNHLNDRIKFFGRQGNPYPYIASADYVILTSEYEGFPVIYLEAITLGVPIISTIDVSDDSIDIGRDSAYIISKDENKMIAEVKNILKHPKQFKNINLDKIQNSRIKELEKIWDGVE